jgi:myo-inositol-1(or 4)-monophosphatase
VAEWRSYELVAAAAAVEAGQAILPWAGGAAEVETKAGAADLVTEQDRRSEALIRAAIRKRFPDHGFFGEEGGGSRQAEFVWYVDPIDGTTNFVHGLPGFSVSVALVHRGQPVAGAVYDPVARELFTASRGGGATLNGRPLSVAWETELGRALLGTGIPPVPPGREWALASIAAVAPRVRNVRNFGSAALHLCYVAAGRLTGFWEPGLHAWDVAAGALILREAGGRVTTLDGREWEAGVRGCVGTNGRIHAALLEALAGVAQPPPAGDGAEPR